MFAKVFVYVTVVKLLSEKSLALCVRKVMVSYTAPALRLCVESL